MNLYSDEGFMKKR